MTKLYLYYEDVILPPRQLFKENIVGHRHYADIKRISHMTLCVWPNGKPCTMVNIWLQEQSYRSTGNETLITYASLISPLIEFCFNNKLSFEDLSDNIFIEFIAGLKLRSGRNGQSSKISKNHIATIVDRALSFLNWLQDNLPQSVGLIIGTESQNPQITVTEHYNKHTGRSYLKHIASPEITAQFKAKRPIPEEAIQQIKDEIFKKRSAVFSHKFNRFGKTVESTLAAEYLEARRIFCVWFLERTGGRPSELCKYLAPRREDYSSTSMLTLPVAKKRKRRWPTRSFALTEYDITEIDSYLDYRDKYIAHLIEIGVITDTPLEMILTEGGTPLPARSLQKDFSRLVQNAGLSEQAISMSLFRHRFITLHILLELKDELESDGKLTDVWGEAVRRKICDRVAEKTGHAGGDSLHPYFDAMFSLRKATGEKSAVERSNDTESAMHTLTRLMYTSIREGIAIDDKIGAFINEIADYIESHAA